MRTCGQCKYFDCDNDADEAECFYFPPKMSVVMATTLSGTAPAVIGYRPKVKIHSRGCVYFDEDLDRKSVT